MINRVFSTFSNYSTYRQRNSVEGLSRSPNRNFDVLKNINNYDSTYVYSSGISNNFDKNNELCKDRSSSIYFSTRTLETKSANLRNTSDNLNYNFRRPYPGISEFESRNRNNYAQSIKLSNRLFERGNQGAKLHYQSLLGKGTNSKAQLIFEANSIFREDRKQNRLREHSTDRAKKHTKVPSWISYRF